MSLTATPERIRRARIAADLTQAQLAMRAGTTLRTVQRYEAAETGNPFQRQFVLLTAEAARDEATGRARR